MRLENHGLRELEINGHDGYYNRVLLLGFVGLERISLIMPSAPVVALLPTWTSLNHKTLRKLTLICKVCRGIYMLDCAGAYSCGIVYLCSH